MSTEQNTRTRQKITKRLVDGLAAGQTVWDADLTGFGVRRQRRDASFVLKYSFRGRQRFYTIGRHGIITVEEARTDARRLLGLAASGIDPAIAREEQSLRPPVLTVGELCASYLKEGPAYKPDKRDSSWYSDRSNINRHIEPLIGQIDLQALDETHVVNFVADVTRGATHCDLKVGHRARAIVKGGKGVAARALAVLSAVYTFGIRKGVVHANPTRNVKPSKGKAPGRFLTTDEWSRLGEALRSYAGGVGANVFVDAINLLALTGCRRSEITRLRWSEVDLEAGLLRLEYSKTGPRTVPLGDQAMRLIAELKRAAFSTWVFPSSRGTGPIVGIQKVWNDIRTRADLPTVRLHDLRHSFASQAINGGASLYLTGAILGHRQSSTTQRYAHLQSDPVRLLATTTAEQVARMLDRKP
ncbi:MAG: tyrosine-type recombinase/integrase [Methylocella sp.]|jgi:integrase